MISSVYAFGEIVGKPIPVPSRHWLVPREWAGLGAKAFSLLFGAVLGAGFFTIVPFVGFYIVVVGCAVLLDPLQSAAVLGSFGAMRGLPVVLAASAVQDGTSFTHEAPIGIVAGYAAADRSLVRKLRITSLICTSVTLIGCLLGGRHRLIIKTTTASSRHSWITVHQSLDADFSYGLR
jgi:hypothetical protein